jgi:DNA mismatch repair protein MutS2
LRESALKEREERLRQKLDEEIETRLRAARQDIDKVVEDLRKQVERLSDEASRRALHGKSLSTGDAGMVRSEARAALDDVARRVRTGGDPGPGEPEPAGVVPRVGDRVSLRSLGLEGLVTAVLDGDVEVDIHGKRMRTRPGDLRVVGGGQAPAGGRVSVSVQVQSREALSTDLNVIGCTVDAALDRVERFFDEVLLTDNRTVRLIHGHGTGQLRRAIGEYLQRHPLVVRHQAAPYDQGGSGVTVVELKD